MHSYCSNNAVTVLNAAKSLKIRSTMNFKNVLLLTSGCKSAPAYSYYYFAPPQNLSRKQNKAILTLCKPLLSFMSELKAFITLYCSAKTNRLSSKSGHGICITRLYKRHVLSLSADK